MGVKEMSNTSSTGQFIRHLDAKRVALGLDNQSFAAYLTEHGVPTTPFSWSRIQNGKQGYKHRWARGVCRIWPDLAGYAAADLLTAA